jgi:head-tail adaptor
MGEYRDRLIIQKRTETVDGGGTPVRAWSQFAVRWGKVRFRSATEKEGGSVTVADQTTEFRMHLTRGIDPKMRLLAPGAVTALAATVTSATTTSLTVASAGGFPLEGRYHLRVADELMEVTSGQGTTTWTVSRGVDGTSAATAYATGQAVQQMTAYDIEDPHHDWPFGVETVVRGRAQDAVR